MGVRQMPEMKVTGRMVGFDGSGDSGGGEHYTLPTATSNRLGGVKIGSGVNVTEDGTISVSGGGGGGFVPISETEIDTGAVFDNKHVYLRTFTGGSDATIDSGLNILGAYVSYTVGTGPTISSVSRWYYNKNTGVFTVNKPESMGTSPFIATIFYTK